MHVIKEQCGYAPRGNVSKPGLNHYDRVMLQEETYTVSYRNQAIWLAKLGLYRYDTDRHIRKTQRMVWYLYITLDFVLQKASIMVDPHYLDVWMPAH
jgi:hypothetical protein